MQKFLGVLAVLTCLGAGLYLLSGQSAAPESTVFDVLMHGIGAYCVARGLWMANQLMAAWKPSPDAAARVNTTLFED